MYTLSEGFRRFVDPATQEVYLRVPLVGQELVQNPMFNKGTAFTVQERRTLGLEGFLPAAVSSMEQQLDRAYGNFRRQPDDLARHEYMSDLQDRNETLYYRLILEHLREMLPIIYTPTVGQACQKYSRIFRRPRGMVITPHHRGRVREVLLNYPFRDLQVIVVTDNERILGLGDQGVGGLGIPIGKSALYVVAGGFHPSRCLPVSLDVGTNNQSLVDDPLYLGVRAPRLRGGEYDSLVDEFVAAVRVVFPHALLQWEDFRKENAIRLHERYREEMLSFNDDVQGTGAVVLAGALSASKIANRPFREERVAILGAGGAGIGIARQIQVALRREGVAEDQARRQIWVLDSHGLLLEGRSDPIEEYKTSFVKGRGDVANWTLESPDRVGLYDVVENVKPTILIGVAGRAGLFDEKIVRKMAKYVERPAILAISNPNVMTEAHPQDVFDWTEGRAVVATGSPFEDVDFQGRKIPISQGNNIFVFPGLGLGVAISHARNVTDHMVTAAAYALHWMVPADRIQHSCVYPDIVDVRKVTRAVALAVAREAVRKGAAPWADEEQLNRRLDEAMWFPQYLPYR